MTVLGRNILMATLVGFLTLCNTAAQSITNYSFSASTSTFTTLSGATSTTLTNGNADDGYVNNIPIGFDFYYMGVRYTTISASTNGWIALGSNITNSETSNNLSANGNRPVIAPLWDDLSIQNISNLTYQVSGSYPSRVFTLQYLNVKWNYEASGNTMSFQVKLYETSGKVEFVYRSEAGAYNGVCCLFLGNTGGASIGITASGTGSGNYLSVSGVGGTPSVSSTTSTNNITTKPATNTSYSFTPSTITAPSNLTFTNIGVSTVQLNWTDNSANEIGFGIYVSTDNVNFAFVAQVAANTTSSVQKLLTGNTLYYWRVYAIRETLGGSVTASVTTCFTLTTVPTSSLASLYKLNGNANDQAGFNNGTFQGGTPTATADRFGNNNAAYTFNGTSQYISTAVAYANPSDFSISLWIKTTTTTGGRLVGFGDASTGNSGNRDRMLYMTNAGKIYFATNPGGTGYVLQSTASYNDGSWHLVSVSCSSTAGSVLYINGAQVAANANAKGGQNYTGYWRINYDQIGWADSPTSNYFNGSMDEVMIYDKALSAAEVSSIYAVTSDGATSNSPVCYGSAINFTPTNISGASYSWSGPLSYTSSVANATISSAVTGNAGTYTVTATRGTCTSGGTTTVAVTYNDIQAIPTTGLIGNYKLNGNGYDETNTNQGVLQNAPSATTDRFSIANSALLLNGSTQYMSTTNSYNNPGTFTLSLWFKTITTNGGKLIGFGGNQTGLSGSYDRHIYMNNAGQLYFGVYPSAVRTLNTTTAYNDGNWHMVTASLSPTNGMRLYVDGTLIASDPTTTSAENYTGYWRVGYDNIAGWTSTPSSNYFSGTLDDVLIYTTELTASQVNTLYTSPDGAGNNGPVCVGSAINFSGTSLSSATYAWSGPNGFSSSSQNPTLTVFTLPYAGTYTLTVTKNGCSSKAYTNVIANTVNAGLWTGISNGNWNTATNWCGGTVPTSTVDVLIPAVANQPTINGTTANSRNLTINALASLTMNANNSLNVYGNFTNNGSFTDNNIYSNTGAVVFRGTSAQSINGATTFSNLTLNNATGLSLNNAVTVNGVLTLTTGTLATNGNLTQNLYTGAIAGTGTGSTTGSIKFTKTIWGDEYHYISTPISGLTAADWNSSVTLKFGTSSNLYTYNETVADTNKKSGWVAVPSVLTALTSLKGYALYFPRWNYNTLFTVTGAYDHSSSYINSTLTNTPSVIPFFKPSSDGWQLMGNPYPSNLDWESASGWTRTGLDNAIYLWDARTDRYVAYVSGIGVNGGTRYIGSMQGFFVKVSTSGGTGTLGISNNARTTSTLKDVWRTQNNQEIFRLKVSHGENEDETVIRLHEEATDQFDSQLDAYKLLNDGNTPSLYSSLGVDYSINSLPADLSNATIPLHLHAPAAGSYAWNADLSELNSDKEFVLEDRAMGTSQNLNENPVLSLTLDKGVYQGRFFLHYSNKQSHLTAVQKSDPTSIEISGYQHRVIVAMPPTSDPMAKVTICDASGKTVYVNPEEDLSSGRLSISLDDVPDGLYIVQIQTATLSKSKQVVLQK